MANENEGVKIRHPDYEKRSPQWVIMRDVMEGDDAIKGGTIFTERFHIFTMSF